MKYIKITNTGLIEPQALHLVGASTKKGNSSKIGQFGSGNKYALAYLLRNGYEVKIFSGEKEIVITTRKETFRDNDFNIIYIDGERTSITTDMGKDWMFWQALREIYSNALDEGGSKMEFCLEIEPKEGETHFYIDAKKDALEFVSGFDNYFATKKKVLFECKDGKILEKSGSIANIYRRGIRCFNTKSTSAFDYDFTDIDIDENRLVKYNWDVEEKLWDLIFQCDNEELIMKILLQSRDENSIEHGVSELASINTKNISDVFRNKLKELQIAPSGFAGMLKPDEIHTHVILPTKIFNSVRSIVGDNNVGQKFKLHRRGGVYREIDTTPLYAATIKEALYFFSETGIKIPYEVITAIFDDKQIMGCAHQEKIVLSDICLENGVKQVVICILEEYIHIKYNVMDETRGFQTAIITEMISYMENKNAFLI